MRISIIQLLVILAVASCVLTEEVSTSEQPSRPSFLRRLKNIYKKGSQGLRNMFLRRKPLAREVEDKKQNPIGEGIDAVMQVIDEYVADGEVAARDAAKSVKEAKDKSKESVKETVAESEEIIPAAITESETAIDTIHKDTVVDEDVIKGITTNDGDTKVELSIPKASDTNIGDTKVELSIPEVSDTNNGDTKVELSISEVADTSNGDTKVELSISEVADTSNGDTKVEISISEVADTVEHEVQQVSDAAHNAASDIDKEEL